MERKKILICIMTLVTILFVMSATNVSAINTHHTVYGYVTDYGGAATNGRTVTVKNVDNQETITDTTYGTSPAGKYQVDLGNMVTQWQAGDQIEVKCTYTSGGKVYYGVETFTISSGDTLTRQDVTIDQWATASDTDPPPGATEPGSTISLAPTPMNILIAIMLFSVVAGIIYYGAGKKGGGKK